MLSPNDLLEIRKIVVATHMVMKGDFADEIKRLEDAAAQAAESHKAEIEAANAKSIQELRAAQAAHDDAAKVAADNAQSSKNLLDQLNVKHAEVAKISADAETKMAELEKQMREFDEHVKARHTELNDRESVVNRREMSLSVKMQQHADAQAALQSKIDTLKSLAG